MKRNHFFTLIILTFCLTPPLVCFSQLYHPSNPTIIASDNVGIGVSNPFGKLEVKEIAGGPAIGGGFNFYPLLRLNSTLASGQSGNLYQWDLRMDGGSDLKFYNLTNGSSAQLALTLSSDAVISSGALKFGNDGFLGESTGIDGTSGMALSLGMQRLNTSSWSGLGSLLLTNSNGDLSVIHNTGGGILNGTTQIAGKEALRITSDRLTANRSLSLNRISSQYTDLEFLDENITGTDKRMYRIRAWKSTSSPYPNIVEFNSPASNASTVFSTPVFVGYYNANANTTDYKLHVAGGIRTEEVKVDLQIDWADYVFNSDYELLSLDELDNFVKREQHLPGVPSAEEVEANGIELGEMNVKLLEKIEELTLYVIDLQKQLNALKTEKDEK